jgi:hypothetical protein
LILLLAVAGCSSGIEARARWDPAAKFEGLETFQWFSEGPSGDPRLDDAFLDKHVHANVDKGLLEKGFRKVDKDPDFLVSYLAVVHDERMVTRRQDSSWDEPSWENFLGTGVGETQTYGYEEGTLVLEIARPGEKKRIMWRGTARAVVDPSDTVDKRRERLRKACEKLLAEFPPDQ